MRKVANVKQVGFNSRFLENMAVCHSKKLTEHPGKKMQRTLSYEAAGKM